MHPDTGKLSLSLSQALYFFLLSLPLSLSVRGPCLFNLYFCLFSVSLTLAHIYINFSGINPCGSERSHIRDITSLSCFSCNHAGQAEGRRVIILYREVLDA
jgi:glucan phosphoethanolaminetransferase (alkaline phosphatase superfamily)